MSVVNSLDTNSWAAKSAAVGGRRGGEKSGEKLVAVSSGGQFPSLATTGSMWQQLICGGFKGSLPFMGVNP